jgi:hypothetical protein
MLYPEDGGITFHRNIGKDLPPRVRKILASRELHPVVGDTKYNFIYIFMVSVTATSLDHTASKDWMNVQITAFIG